MHTKDTVEVIMKTKLTITLVSIALAFGAATAVASANPNGPPPVEDPAVPPDPIWPETTQDCRWTGFNTPDGELDTAYWEYYRQYYNLIDPDGEAGDVYFGKQGDCMKNRGEPLYP